MIGPGMVSPAMMYWILIASYPNIKAVFHGHDHDVNGIMLNQKKPYLWSGHFGGSWGSSLPGYTVYVK
jgi:hypothetical protein